MRAQRRRPMTGETAEIALTLAADTAPVRRHAGEQRLALALGGGVLAAVAWVLLVPAALLVRRAPAADSAGIVSFAIDDIHPHDLGTILDEANVAIRAGHHCAQPLMDYLGVPATARASFGLYSTEADIDALLAGIARTRKIFGKG